MPKYIVNIFEKKGKRIVMRNSILSLMIIGIILPIFGCLGGTAADYKYVFTGETGEAPPRTVDAAKAQFHNDESLIIGQSTESDIKKIMGSPMEIQKKSSGKVYVYLKSVETSGVSVDVGTNYIAQYAVDSKGRLSSKDYKASPMSNPLLQ